MNHTGDIKWKNVCSKSQKNMMKSIPTVLPFYIPEFREVLRNSPSSVSADEISSCITVAERWKTSLENSSLREILTQKSPIHWEHFCKEIIYFRGRMVVEMPHGGYIYIFGPSLFYIWYLFRPS